MITILITHFRGLIILLITTHEPPSSQSPGPKESLLPKLSASARSPLSGVARRAFCVPERRSSLNWFAEVAVFRLQA